MSSFGPALNYRFNLNERPKEQRRSPRKKVGADAWIRSGFAVRPCKVVDISDIGVRIKVGIAQTVSSSFTFLTSRDASSGRRARVKWRHGTQIGAEFQ